MRIVHVDDDRDFLEFFSEIVQNEQYHHDVTSLDSEHGFYQWLQKFDVDTLNRKTDNRIAFIIAPQMNASDSGLKCMRSIRSTPWAAASIIVALSNSRKGRDVEQAYSSGANLYIAKGESDFSSRDVIVSLLESILQAILPPQINFKKPYYSERPANESENTETDRSPYWDVADAENHLPQFLDAETRTPQILARQNEGNLEVTVRHGSALDQDSSRIPERVISVRLLSKNILALLQDHRKHLHGNNQISPEEREAALAALERLENSVAEAERASRQIPNTSGEIDNFSAEN